MEDWLPRVLTEAERISAIVTEATWYLFGSYASSPGAAADIDILVVCSSHAEGSLVRREMEDAAVDMPLDLLLMTTDEERETNFVLSERCSRIFPSDEAERLD